MMVITSVELTLPRQKNQKAENKSQKFRGWAKVVFSDVLWVTGIKLFEDNSGAQISRYIRFPDAIPSLHETHGELIYIPIVNTNDKKFRKNIVDAVFAEYDRVINSEN